MPIRTLSALRPSATTVDFYRPVHAILGLPVDAVTLHATQTLVYAAITKRRSLFLSTPNLNFAMGALDDSGFRNSVINSDLSIADGMPLLWVARLFGIAIHERVTGSGLFEKLQREPDRIVSVYLFGGEDGMAATAAAKLNVEPSGLQCVGSWSPGFGSLEEMSSDAIISDINNSHADFLVVALGAKKGQAWIERNRRRLTVPVLSHLGAVLNFTAGSVRRAPSWMQQLGLEWLWRIKEEPALWRRYLHDVSKLMRLLLTRILPGALYQRLRRPNRTALANAWVSFSGDESRPCITPHGAWCENNLLRMRRSFEKVALRRVDVDIDLAATTFADTAFVGLLMLMYGHQTQHGLGFALRNVSPALRRIFKSCCAEFLLEAQDAANTTTGQAPSYPWRERIAAGS